MLALTACLHAELDFLHEAQNSARCAANLDSKRSRVRGRVAVSGTLPQPLPNCRSGQVSRLAGHRETLSGPMWPACAVHAMPFCLRLLRLSAHVLFSARGLPPLRCTCRCRRWTWGAPATA